MPRNVGPTPQDPDKYPEAKLDGPGGFTLTLPLPKWAVGLLAAILILALVLGSAYWGYTKFSGSMLIPQEDANDYKETTKHDLEPDDTKESQEITFHDGVKVTLRHFHTDGCVEVLRTSQALVTDKHWLRDLRRIAPPPTSAATPYENHGRAVSAGNGLLLPFSVGMPIATVSFFPTDFLLPPTTSGLLQGLNPRLTPTGGAPPAGGCINPHPGQFQTWNGAVNGCWTQVWRHFEDGCTHYQWYNRCYNVWDTNPDGSAKVFWTYCVH